ncbi:hypothetical protein ACIRBX_02610 [Kitasatospora sp. NPDC096147]|uniref:DUF7927 domain-containing protein n=1 Tax=Kitasatospora sp. NPDC096147 TaxID=3364093 RepID=UPI003806536F
MQRQRARTRALALAASVAAIATVAAGPAPQLSPAKTRGAGTERPIGQDPAVNLLARGNLTMASNSVLACDDSQGDECTDNSYNNGRTKWVKSDPNAPGNTASAATLTIPPGSKVLSARLYWQLNPDGTSVTSTSGDASKADQVEFKVPGAAGYQRLTADTYDWFDQQTGGNPPKPITAHAGVKDVTDLVGAAGSGSYTVADIQACQGRSSTADYGGQNVGCWGGWSLVVAYENPSEPLRYLQVWDGYQLVRPPNSATTMTLSGIRTSPNQAPAATMGVTVGDGDTPIAGDSLEVGPDTSSLTKLKMPTPSGQVVEDNAFTGRIDRVAADGTGSNITDRDPNPVNNLGYDARIIDITGKLPAGSRQAVLRINGEGDALHPQAVWLALAAVEPDLQIAKANDPAGSTDDNPPGLVEAGGQVTYSFTVTNRHADGSGTDLDTATGVALTDDLPAGASFVAGSNPDCSASGQTVTCQVADLAPGASATVSFKAAVEPGTAAGTKLDNTGSVSFTGAQTGRTQQRDSNTVRNTVTDAPKYAVTKAADKADAAPGDRVTYTVTVENTGTVAIEKLNLTDDLTEVLDDAEYGGDATASTGQTSYQAPVLSWTGDLAPAAKATITYSVTVRQPAAGDDSMVNTAVTDRAGGNCLADSTDPACTATVRVQRPSPSPSPSPSPEPSGSPSPEPSPSSSPAPSGSTTPTPGVSPRPSHSPDSGTDQGGLLPHTGATVTLAALMAGATLIVGFVLFRLSRRGRRS